MKIVTKIVSCLFLTLYTIIFGGAMIYAVEQMVAYTSLKELFFWSAISLLLLSHLTRILIPTDKKTRYKGGKF